MSIKLDLDRLLDEDLDVDQYYYKEILFLLKTGVLLKGPGILSVLSRISPIKEKTGRAVDILNKNLIIDSFQCNLRREVLDQPNRIKFFPDDEIRVLVCDKEKYLVFLEFKGQKRIFQEIEDMIFADMNQYLDHVQNSSMVIYNDEKFVARKKLKEKLEFLNSIRP